MLERTPVPVTKCRSCLGFINKDDDDFITFPRAEFEARYEHLKCLKEQGSGSSPEGGTDEEKPSSHATRSPKDDIALAELQTWETEQ